jgi:peptide/nickel transport system substrate-binding protein
MRSTTILALVATSLSAVAATGCGKAAPGVSGTQAQDGVSSRTTISATTPAPTRDVQKVTWALYADVGSLDPVQAFFYPENTVTAALCESLVRQEPDGTLTAGLSALPQHPNPTTTVLKINAAAKFWDGKPVTPADVAFSLNRAADPKAGGFYSGVFSEVKSIAATGSDEVTITLAKPDYWLDGELSQMPGVVVEKAYAEAKGRKFGTPQGGTMCTGPYKVASWQPGASLKVVRNDGYWDSSRKARVAEIDFRGVPDDASLTTGLATGAIQGTYPLALGAMSSLEGNSKVSITRGPTFVSDALAVTSLKGVLGDLRVRQALSLALDRKAYIQTLYHGAAQLPRTLAAPGTWGYGRDVFQADWDKLPEPTQDLAKAKELVKQAGAEGKTLTVGMSSEINSVATSASAVRTAGEAIGLKVRLKAVSAQNYGNFFADPAFRAGVDVISTLAYPDYADPGALYAMMALKGGNQNLDGYSDPQTTRLLEKARATADPTARAKLVVQAGDRIGQQLPWIPVAAPNTVLITSSELTGAPASFTYMGGPWANLLGGK